MTYRVEPKDKFFQVFCTLPEREVLSGPGVIFTAPVDLQQVESIREAAKTTGLRGPSYTAFVIKAVALALREFPYANGRVFRILGLPFLGPRLQRFHAVDIAVATERDVPGRASVAFVDVLRNADEGSLDEIGEWLHRLGTSDTSTNEQWRTLSTLVRRFPASLASFLIRLPCWFPGLWVKYRGAAVLVSSPAKYGVDSVIAEWAWPIGVSFGLVKPRPVVRDGQIVACPVSNLVMNFDRRVMAGAQAARFFKRIVDLLEHAQVELAAMLSSASSPTARPNGHPGSSLSPRPGP